MRIIRESCPCGLLFVACFRCCCNNKVLLLGERLTKKVNWGKKGKVGTKIRLAKTGVFSIMGET